MIDARRMEVFTAVFKTSGETIVEPMAAVLDETLFKTRLEDGKIIFFGGGAAKFKPLVHHPNAVFASLEAGQEELARISWNLYQAGVFSNLIQTAPQYVKDFHSPSLRPGL
jgi:tRNA threonylcarbamoyladenosine biosynthesis protein TsaB